MHQNCRSLLGCLSTGSFQCLNLALKVFITGLMTMTAGGNYARRRPAPSLLARHSSLLDMCLLGSCYFAAYVPAISLHLMPAGTQGSAHGQRSIEMSRHAARACVHVAGKENPGEGALCWAQLKLLHASTCRAKTAEASKLHAGRATLAQWEPWPM